MSRPPSHSTLSCNLCWKELKESEPFIVTSCEHLFCMDHANDERIRSQTCPGCGHHLPSKGGLNQARFRIAPEESSSLNGLQPNACLELASNAIRFWVSQERTVAEYHRHQARAQERKKEEQKEQFRQVHADLSQEIARLRQQVEASQAREDDFKHENRLLQEKYQEETHKLRTLQERFVAGAKRRRPGDSNSASPIHPGSATPERGGPLQGDLLPRLPPRSPLHSHPTTVAGPGPCSRVGLGTNSTPRTFPSLGSPAPHRASFDSSAHLSAGGLGGLAGGGLAGAPAMGSGGGARGLPPRFGLGGSIPPLTATPTHGSRHSTPIHRSQSFMAAPGLGGLGARNKSF